MYHNYLLELSLQRLRLEELEHKMALRRHELPARRPGWRNLNLLQRFKDRQNRRRNRRLSLGRSAA